MKVLPVLIELVTGTTRFGFAGVLLESGLPVSSCTEPCESTCLKGTMNVRIVAVGATLDTYDSGKSIAYQADGRLCLALMIISFDDVDRTTLQNTFPSGSGKVLGRYSSPRLRLNS